MPVSFTAFMAAQPLHLLFLFKALRYEKHLFKKLTYDD
jgi:hypothetical protein